ncbi:putative signal transducing protein [Chloroflexota bacterium]
MQGKLAAQIIKSHLESEGIPVLLKYESAGIIYGLTIDGLGEVRILVPQEFAEDAQELIKPQE